MLMGYYSVDKNIIISLDKSTNENKKEIVLNPDENNILTELENNSSNEAHLIKYKNNNKYYNGKKLHFIKKLYVNPNCYNIYSIFHSEKQRTYKADKIMEDAKKKNNLYDYESKDNIYAGNESVTQNYNFLMQSQASSTFAQVSNDTQNYKKRDKGGKKENKKTRYYIYFQLGLIIFNLFIFLVQLICHIILNYSINEYNNQNLALVMLKNYYGVFNNVFTSVLSITKINLLVIK